MVRRINFAPGEELTLYRRKRAGKQIAVKYRQHFAALPAWQLAWLERAAGQLDEQDKRIRAEIAQRREAYGWHKSLGQLPYDWSDAELTRLWPDDWRQVRTVRFVRTSRASAPKQPRPRVRSRERRPRRTSSSSTTSSADPPSHRVVAGDHPLVVELVA